MTPDDREELTPPDGYVFHSLPPTATLPEVINQANHQYRLSISTFNRLSEIHGYLFNGTIPCTKPADKCTALEMVTKLRKKLGWQQWLIAAITLVVPATVTIVGLIMANYGSAKANEAATQATKTTLAVEMPKYMQSVETIVDAAVERGSDRALRKYTAEQQPKPIVKIPDRIHRTP